MDFRDINWEDCEDAVDDGTIDDTEALLGVRLPADFRECVKYCHGGTPEVSRFTFTDQWLGEMTSGMGVLLSLTDEDEGLVVTRQETEFLPEGLIPFGDDGGGDLMCFDYRSDPEAPTVVYWHAERGEHPDAVTYLAKSFSEFLDLLT